MSSHSAINADMSRPQTHANPISRSVNKTTKQVKQWFREQKAARDERKKSITLIVHGVGLEIYRPQRETPRERTQHVGDGRRPAGSSPTITSSRQYRPWPVQDCDEEASAEHKE